MTGTWPDGAGKCQPAGVWKAIEDCPLCGRQPGTKVGPPAKARCITDGCAGMKLAAETIDGWNARIRSTFPTTPTQDATALADEIARWLHDETSHPESYPNHTWPETERDDGQREGGFVKIVPLHGQEYFRDIARRLIARFAALRAVPQTPDAVREAQVYTAELHLNGKYTWCIVKALPRVETVIQEFGYGPDAYRTAQARLLEIKAISTPSASADWKAICDSYAEENQRLSDQIDALTASAGPQKKPWIEGEPEECDGSAWDRLPPLVTAGPQAEAVAWLVLSEETGNTRIWWRDKARADKWCAQHNATPIALYAHPQPQQAVGRGAVIEECAQIAEAQNWCGGGAIVCGDAIARRIRALQQSPATDGPAK